MAMNTLRTCMVIAFTHCRRLFAKKKRKRAINFSAPRTPNIAIFNVIMHMQLCFLSCLAVHESNENTWLSRWEVGKSFDTISLFDNVRHHRSHNKLKVTLEMFRFNVTFNGFNKKDFVPISKQTKKRPRSHAIFGYFYSNLFIHPSRQPFHAIHLSRPKMSKQKILRGAWIRVNFASFIEQHNLRWGHGLVWA